MNTAPAKKPPAGAPAWMVTFADLMALLLCLFVLLLSFAEMDVKLYKQIAGSMRDAFGSSRVTKLVGVIEQEGVVQRDVASQVVNVPMPETPALPDESTPVLKEVTAGEAEQESRLTKSLNVVLAKEIEAKEMSIDEKDGVVMIRFPEKTAYPAGSDNLSEKFQPILRKIAGVLSESEGVIGVVGHSDDRPISTERFRSNWDLSTARAVSVVHYILEISGIDPSRLSAQGFAASRPLVPNDTPEHRAMNRRVEITVRVE